jgi:hypothetical protein
MTSDQRSEFLGRLTTGVLLLVLVCVAWIVLAGYQPEWGGFISIDVQAGLIIFILLAALVLVSIVALKQTRS